ncbi:MAG: hypothetical protein IIA92_11425 [Chloroflexi bacterium]|nr:hypothetical protein [Chloroflexota bacterium]
MIGYKDLEEMSSTDIRKYVEDRVYERRPANPPLSPRDGDYTDFLVAAIHESSELRYSLADVVELLIVEIWLTLKNGDAKESHTTALANLSLLVSHLRHDLPVRRSAKGALESLALEWTKYQVDTDIGHVGNLLLNSLAISQREKDSIIFWQELWEKDDRPDLWTFAFTGLARESFFDSMTELGLLTERGSSGRWDPISALWSLYHLAVGRDQYLKEFADELHILKISQAEKLLTWLKDSGAEENYLNQLQPRAPILRWSSNDKDLGHYREYLGEYLERTLAPAVPA